MLVKVGSYTGNGADNREISGIGFQPDFVLIKAVGSIQGVMRFGTMSGDITFPIRNFAPESQNWGALANLIQSIGADGFQIGTAAGVNTNATVYHYIAIKGEAGNGFQSSFVGTGADKNVTGFGFQPDWVLAKTEWQWGGGAYKPSTLAGDTFISLNNAGVGGSDVMQSLNADGYTSGANEAVNHSPELTHFLGLKNQTGVFKVGSYTGDGTDDRSITGLGFQPDCVLITPAYATGTNTIIRFKDQVGDASLITNQSGGTAADKIQGFLADGFQVGANDSVNRSGQVNYWTAWKDTTVVASAIKNMSLLKVG